MKEATQMTPEEALADVWEKICQRAERDGVAPLNKYPGLWNFTAGAWSLTVNGQKEPASRDGVTIQPFNGYVEFNGWPAGFIDPYTATIAAGELANIWTLAEALTLPEAKGGE